MLKPATMAMAPGSSNGIERHFLFAVVSEKLEVMSGAKPRGATQSMTWLYNSI